MESSQRSWRHLPSLVGKELSTYSMYFAYAVHITKYYDCWSELISCDVLQGMCVDNVITSDVYNALVAETVTELSKTLIQELNDG